MKKFNTSGIKASCIRLQILRRVREEKEKLEGVAEKLIVKDCWKETDKKVNDRAAGR